MFLDKFLLFLYLFGLVLFILQGMNQFVEIKETSCTYIIHFFRHLVTFIPCPNWVIALREQALF